MKEKIFHLYLFVPGSAHRIEENMDIFNAITLFGGLAMFLYGMRMMGDGLKASSSGTLKKAM